MKLERTLDRIYEEAMYNLIGAENWLKTPLDESNPSAILGRIQVVNRQAARAAGLLQAAWDGGLVTPESDEASLNAVYAEVKKLTEKLIPAIQAEAQSERRQAAAMAEDDIYHADQADNQD